VLRDSPNAACGPAPGIRAHNFKEIAMSRCRLAPLLAIAAVMIGLGWPQLGLAQTPVPTQSIDPFGQEVNLTAKTIVYVAGAGLKASGPAMTIYTSTDDTGFDFKAAIPVAEAPKSPPGKEIAVGQSPDGKMLKFVHRGSYDEMNQTYEAITNFLDEKGLDAKDLLIEEYLTDLVTSPQEMLVVNVLVPLR
jgi:effector-binding domain-containing protein